MILFYDGHCGLCHGAVRFILRRDRAAEFRFAPLQGETFKAAGLGDRTLPDSMVLQTSDGKLLLQSSAWIHILDRLGGVWKVLAKILSVIPRALADAGYTLVARCRRLIFGRRDTLCPLVPPELRERFEP